MKCTEIQKMDKNIKKTFFFVIFFHLLHVLTPYSLIFVKNYDTLCFFLHSYEFLSLRLTDCVFKI
jgi:hypothetical protein